MNLPRTSLRAAAGALLLSLTHVTAAGAQDVWVSVPSGTTQDLRGVHFPTADVGYVAGAAGTVRRSIDGGLSWTDASPAGAPDLHDLHFLNLEVGVVVGEGGAIYRTLNAGIDWTPVASGVEVPLYAVSFSGNVGIIGGGSQTILRSENGGATWTIIQGDFFGGGFRGAHMLDAANVFVAGQNSIFQPLFGASDDGGLTFDFTAFYLNTNEGTLRDVRFLTPSTGVVAGVTFDGQGSLSRTTNGGTDWTTTLFPQQLEAVDFATESVGYAVGHGGSMLRTSNGGASWTPTTPVLSAELADVHFPTPTLGFAVGTSGTILRGAIVTAAAPAGSGSVLTLEHSPNPTASATQVGFEVPAAGPVSLTLHDALGRRVSTLADGPRAAGRHEVQLDVSALPAGVYVLTLEAGQSRAVRRVVVGGR